VAVVVCGLQFSGWTGEQEGAPVGDAAHDAALVEDDFACGFGDSRNDELDVHFGRRKLRANAMGGRNYSFTSERRPGRTCTH
jgi:hypothetical protein